MSKYFMTHHIIYVYVVVVELSSRNDTLRLVIIEKDLQIKTFKVIFKWKVY